MAGNMRVSILLDFIKKGRGARDARDDLKGLKQEATGLKTVGGADRLNRSLVETSSKARKLAGDLAKAKAEAKALGATDARPKVSPYNRLKEMARPKERAADMMRASATGALAAGAGGLGLAGIAGGGIVAGMAAKGVRAGLDLERAMYDVSRATDASGKDLAAYQKEIVRLSLATGKAAPELAAMLAAAGFAGRPKDELMDFTRYAGQAMTAWGTTADETGQALAEIGSIYQANQKRIEEIGDAINTAADQSASKETDLLEVLRRVGASGRMLGVSAEQTLALGAALREVGTQPAVVGTALQALFTNLSLGDGATKEFADGLKAIGMNAKKLQKNVRKDATGAIVDLLKRIEQVPDKLKKVEVLKNLFGREYADNMGALLNNLPGLERMLALMANKKNYAGSVARDAAKRLQTDVSRLERAQEAINELARRVGEPLKIAAGSVAEGINTLLKAYDGLKDAQAKIEEAAQRIASGEARPGDVEAVAKAPDGAQRVAEATYNRTIDQNKSDAEATGSRINSADRAEKVRLELELQRRNAEREINALEASRTAGTATIGQVRRLAQLKADMATMPKPGSIDPRTPADATDRADDRRLTIENEKADRDLLNAKVRAIKALEDALPDGTAKDQVRSARSAAEDGYGPPAPPGTPADVPLPPRRPADISILKEMAPTEQHGPPMPSRLDFRKKLEGAFNVDLQPAAESVMLKYAAGIAGSQGAVDGAAQQVGEGVKGKLAAVDAGAAGQQAMASFAQGIAAGGAQAVAAAQRVAAQVQSALAVKVAGGASVRSRTSGALHDGVG